MQKLSPLASQILQMLAAPLTVKDVRLLFSDATTADEIEAVLYELVPHHATLDEHEGVPYFCRRDFAAEKVRMSKWSDAQRAAERARRAAIDAAERAYVVAMDAADAERDSADPMAAIKAARVGA